MVKLQKCIICRQEYKVYPSQKNSKCCSKKCLNKYFSKKYLGENNPFYHGRIETKCDNCNKTIYKGIANFNKYKKHFCDYKCMHEWQAKNWRGKNSPINNLIDIECGICKKKVLKKESWVNRVSHNFCSAKCYGIWLKKNIKGENNPNFNSIKCICKKCGREFWKCQAAIKLGEGIFCSKECFYKYRGESEIEKKVRKELKRRTINFEQEKIINCKKGLAYSIDFFIPPKYAIEVDGSYWHSLPSAIIRDKKKEGVISLLGYRLFRLPEEKIRENVEQCVGDILCQM